MTDKEQIIIDGIIINACLVSEKCKEFETCKIKNILSQLVRKTKECEELKEKIKQVKDFKDKVINQLKEENKVLKKQVVRCSEGWGKADCEKNWYQQAEQAKQEENHDLTMKLYEYRKALEEIEGEIKKYQCDNCEEFHCDSCDMKDILDIIRKAKGSL